MNRSFVLYAAALTALVQVSCNKTPPPNVAADVNGHAITYAELDKIFAQSQQPSADKPNEDQIAAGRLELLNSMITSEIMLQRAERLGLTAVDSDVEAEFNKMKSPYTKEQFEARLAEKKMTADDLKTQIRHDLTLNKLINKEVSSHITITDSDVANFFNANKDAFNHKEPSIRLAQILVTPQADPNVHNLKGSKATNDKQARDKIEDIYNRLQRGEDFGMLAQNYSEDPNTAANGGDMGPIPESNLDKVSKDLKQLVLTMPVGVPSKPIASQYGYQILKVISREPAGQRELNDPRVQQEIRDALISRKTQLLQAAFFETARNEAKVQNYLARSIVQSAGGTVK